jgi:diguanylate cyclase (GGDEF)-like protein
MLQGPSTDPVAVAEIGAAIAAGRSARVRLRNYRADGSTWWNELLLCPVHDSAGQLTHYIGVQNDVTAQVEAERTVLHLAYHDALTGLPNRARLDDALTAALTRRKRTATATALLFIDLDNFKAVNDRHGHSAGDALLRQVATRLRSAVRADDLLARQGGDEFLVLLTDLPLHDAAAVAARAADQLLHALREPFDVHGIKLEVAASVGISVDTDGVADADDLRRTADAAMYTAKKDGGARHHWC